MSERYEEASTRLAEVNIDIAAYDAKRSELKSLVSMMDGRDELLTEFEESLWLGIVHLTKADSAGGFTFVMNDQSGISWTSK